MSDTPRTDEAYSNGLTYALVATSKQIEREINEANADRLRLREALEAISHEAGKQWQATQPLPHVPTIEDIATNALDESYKGAPPPVVAKADADALADALINIEEYWNRDHNDTAMADACWHAVNLAQSALETYRNKYKEGEDNEMP